MNEAKLWRWLADGRLPPGDYTRIESPMSPGVPDVNFSLDDGTSHGWIELKIGAPGAFPFQRVRHGLRPAQAIFIKERVRRGTPIAIVAYIAPTIALWRLRGAQLDAFNTWDRATLKYHAKLWVDRSELLSIDPNLLRPATRQK